jgi:hypothetical protein
VESAVAAAMVEREDVVRVWDRDKGVLPERWRVEARESARALMRIEN